MLKPPKQKYLDKILTKYVQDLYEKNYKTLSNKIKEELNKQRGIPRSRIGRLSRCKFSPI